MWRRQQQHNPSGPASQFPKRMNPSRGSSAPLAAASTAQPAVAEAAPYDSKMSETQMRDAAKTASAWMFPWERRQMDGRGELKWWEKLYWGVFVSGLAFLLFQRAYRKPVVEESEEDKAAREAHKAERARLALAGDNFIAGDDDEDDPFSGMTPTEIQAYVAASTSTAGATRDDPFAGMTPEEINDYMSRHGRTSIE